jgi:hypothetical protein
MLAILASVLFMGVDSGGNEADGREVLLQEKRALLAKIASLTDEQAFLQFQKEMYRTDSRYLVLHLSAGTGQLKYKNRILKEFQFTFPKQSDSRHLHRGMLAVTKKTEGNNDRHALMLGSAFVLQWKRASMPSQAASIPAFSLSKKDMASLFFALDVGSPAYLVP